MKTMKKLWSKYKDRLLPLLQAPRTTNILLILVLLALWGILSELHGGIGVYVSGGSVDISEGRVTIDNSWPIKVRIEKY